MSGAVDIKVPLEALSYRFRRLQKHLSREVEAEIQHIVSLQDTFDAEKCAAIRSRLDALRSLTLSTDVIEKECLSKIRTRAVAVAAHSLSEEDRTVVLVADYLLRLREFDCVEHIVAEYGDGRLWPFLDIEEHREAHRVEAAITAGELETAVEWCHSHASKLRRIGSVLEFYLCQEAFLERVYGDRPQEALQYAQSHLAGLVSVGSEENAVQPSHAGTTARASEARPRAATMGSSPAGDSGAGAVGRTAVVPSFNEFIGGVAGGSTNNSISHSSSAAGGSADGHSDLTHTMRHLTSLLVYPSTSPEVQHHPRFGPAVKADRLRYILQLFRIDFRRVYGYPERSPLETYLATGVAVLKTPACASTLLGRDSCSPNNEASGTSRDNATAPAARRPRGVGATLNRLLSGSSSSDNGEGSPPRGRPSGRILSGLSNIGGFLTMSSRRSRSQSMSAVEEQISPVISPTGRAAVTPLESVQKAEGLHRSHSNGDATDHGTGLSGSAAHALLGLNGNRSSSEAAPAPCAAPLTQEMSEYPCYHPSRRVPRGRLEVDPLEEGARRAEQCPVCSQESGVGSAVAGAVPCFPSPVSVLVCRGSGKVMTHDNPPMALPNGQVFSRNFLLSTSVHKTVPVIERDDSIAGGIRTAARALRPSFAREPIPTLPRRPPPPVRGFTGREESRWSVLRRLAARSVARSTASATPRETRIYREDRWTTSTLEPPLSPLQDREETNPMAPEESSVSRVQLSRGSDGVLRSRSEAAASAPPLRLSPIRDSSRADPFHQSPTRIYFQVRSPVTATSEPMDIEERVDEDEEDSQDSSFNDVDDDEEEEGEEMDSESDGTMDEDEAREEGEPNRSDDQHTEVESGLMSAREAIDTREVLHMWRDGRIAPAERARLDEAELSTGGSVTEGARTDNKTAMEAGDLSDNGATEIIQFAVCPITGEHFEFSKLRAVFLA